ncbi:MAG: molybdopterin-dependent oxidoreductase [Actinobacteria bacterium]|nr:molybdopterin-dependent oxidoreductase [Actinomycetota bacterium]
MSEEHDHEQRLSRGQVVGGFLGGAGALALPGFLRPGDAFAADEATKQREMASFLGQDELPVPPPNARVRTSACQYCNVGCGYKMYTWPVKSNPQQPGAAGPYPKGALGDWISPAMVTRAEVEGVDSYVAVVPDRDCIVNKGDHSPRGGTNALTVYTTRKHPLTNPTERLLYPQLRARKGGPLKRVSWNEALNVIADRIKDVIDRRGPHHIGLWAADHLSPEMNFATTKLFFAPSPRGLYNPALGPDDGVAVRAIHNRPKWNSEHPSIGEHFGSASTLLYSYRDLEIADTVLIAGANSYETGTVLYNRMHARPNKKVVIDPRRTVPAQNARDLGGVHLQLRPNTDVVLVNSIMYVILSEGREDKAFIKARVDPASFEQLRRTVLQEKYRPENARRVTGVPATQVRKAARLLGRPNDSSILFEKGIIWSGTQNEAVMSTYANLALLVGAIGRPGRVFGRQGGHQSAYMYDFDWPHPQGDGDQRRNLWQELERGRIDLLIFAIANPLRMQQQTNQLRDFVKDVPFVVDINIRPSDTSKFADLVLPAAAWGEYTYTRENLERRVRVNQQFYDPPGEAVADYLIFSRIANRLARRHGLVDRSEWNFSNWRQVYNAMRQTQEGKNLGLHALSPKRLEQLGTNGIQLPITKRGKQLIGTERLYATGFPTPDGRARFVAKDQSWTEDDPLAFLPAEIKPNREYPFFVTTVRYQSVWQSGYTYRWTHDLAMNTVPFMEFVVNPRNAKKYGLEDGDWAELRNQYGATEGVVNVSNQVPPGLISAIFGWQGPTDGDPEGNSRYYANNLIAGGHLQQRSNGAFFKNTRAALRKLDRPPRTAKNTPRLSEKQRYGRVSGPGLAGNPDSKAEHLISVPTVARGVGRPPSFGAEG